MNNRLKQTKKKQATTTSLILTDLFSNRNHVWIQTAKRISRRIGSPFQNCLYVQAATDVHSLYATWCFTCTTTNIATIISMTDCQEKEVRTLISFAWISLVKMWTAWPSMPTLSPIASAIAVSISPASFFFIPLGTTWHYSTCALVYVLLVLPSNTQTVWGQAPLLFGLPLGCQTIEQCLAVNRGSINICVMET